MANKVDEIKNQLAQRLEKQSALAAAATNPLRHEEVPPPIHDRSDSDDLPAVEDPALNAKNKTKVKAIPSNRHAKGDKGTVSSGVTGAGKDGGVIKLSASLYDYDIECLDRIRNFMRGKGVRNITDSEALRLACRAAVIDDRFLEMYEEMSKQDGRRRNSRGSKD